MSNSPLCPSIKHIILPDIEHNDWFMTHQFKKDIEDSEENRKKIFNNNNPCSEVMLVKSKNEHCLCCQEHVGAEDADVITTQLKNCEKQCTWCGDDFDIPDGELEYILEEENNDGRF